MQGNPRPVLKKKFVFCCRAGFLCEPHLDSKNLSWYVVGCKMICRCLFPIPRFIVIPWEESRIRAGLPLTLTWNILWWNIAGILESVSKFGCEPASRKQLELREIEEECVGTGIEVETEIGPGIQIEIEVGIQE